MLFVIYMGTVLDVLFLVKIYRLTNQSIYIILIAGDEVWIRKK